MAKPISDTELNSVYIDLRSINEKITKDLVCAVIFSNRIEQYNPFFEFYNSNCNMECDNEIIKLFAKTITIPKYAEEYDTFILKWMVSIIASIHGIHSPLALVLTGGINTGKTEWFRRLLPRELFNLYTEEKLIANSGFLIF